MSNRKIEVQGIVIKLQKIEDDDYVSLTDIAKKFGKPKNLIRNWMRNSSTLGYLAEWEKLYNPDFNEDGFKELTALAATQGGRFSMSPKLWIETTNAIGLRSSSGRYNSGTFSHSTIAISFAYWLSPQFQIYFVHAFLDLIKKEYDKQNLEWHISKITDSIDEARNLLDTIPHQQPSRNRLNPKK